MDVAVHVVDIPGTKERFRFFYDELLSIFSKL